MRTLEIFLRLLFGIFPKNCQTQNLRIASQWLRTALWTVVVALLALASVAYKIVCYDDDAIQYANNDGRIIAFIVYGLIAIAVGCWALMPDEPARQPTRT